MGKVYKSTDRKLPRELRRSFTDIVGTAARRPIFAATTKSFDPEGEMVIEGIANLAEPDRWGEVIVPSAWRLDQYKANPIMLYEHWRENAIGTCTEILTRLDGLYYRATIGNPKLAPLTPTQEVVRSLLAQGILKANSVGFIPHVVEWDEDEDVLRYTDAELLEISIVAIPMQQDSIITSVKSWRQRHMGQQSNKGEGDEPVTPEMKAMIEENTRLTKGCHEMLTKMCATDDTAKAALGARIKELETQLATEKTAREAVEKKAQSLIAALRTKGLIKPAA